MAKNPGRRRPSCLADGPSVRCWNGPGTASFDGGRGLAAFKTGNFDLVCLDIFMPTMDGLETIRLVREQQPAIPIIAISGRPVIPVPSSEPDFLATATKLGAVRGLPKPFRPAALLATVADCLTAATKPSAQPAPDGDVASRG